jgi:hypothetical protein
MSLREKRYGTTFVLASLGTLAMATAPTLAQQQAIPPAAQAALDEQVLLTKTGRGRLFAIAHVSPDGRLVTYVRENNQTKLLVNGQPVGPVGDATSKPLFSSDGRRLAFSVLRGNRISLIVDGEERASWAANRLDLLTFVLYPPNAQFSPDGENLAYQICETEGKQERRTTHLLGQPP